jgi:helicase
MKNISEMTGDQALDLALDTIKIKKQAIVFANTKSSAEKSAESLANEITLKSEELDRLADECLHSLSAPTKQCERLANCIKKGVAFHHAGLTSGQRDIIEENFKKGIIKIICSTPTLAAGVDLPAFRTILKDLRRFGKSEGLSWIPVLEYLQMAGRAGRPKYDSFGESVAIANTPAAANEIKDRYLNGEPEDILSKLAVEPVLRTYLLSLIATDFVNTKKDIVDFFSKTFWSHHFRDMERLEAIITRMLGLLEDFEFITCSTNAAENKALQKKHEFVSASDIRSEKYTATILGKRVAELYIDPLTADYFVECMKISLKKKSYDTFALMQMVSHTLELRPLLRVKSSEMDDIMEKYAGYEDLVLENEPNIYENEYDEFMASIKTAFMFLDWVDEKSEEELMEKYNVRPGELKVKLDNADWLLYSAEEIARITKSQPLLKELAKARFRLKYGAKEELFPLLKLKSIGRTRARAMFRNKIRDIADVKKVDIIQLVQILGKKTAINVKKQVGIDLENEKVPERKRKGQISLKDY